MTQRRYGPPVVKQCEYCKKEYSSPNHRAHKSRFCSITCHNKSGTLERTQYTCIVCSEKFMARPDHGADRKFCSRECFRANALPPIEKPCENCGGLFTAIASNTATRGDGWRLFCSTSCYHDNKRKFEERPCVYCGKMFYPRSTKHDQTQQVCSTDCKGEFYSGANSHAFQGGTHVVQQTNHKMVLVGKRRGYASKYLSEHRLLISKHIGRMLTKNEVVIHINNQGLDNRLSNLYVCESMSEFARRRHGSLPWPKQSNLDTFKEKSSE